MTLTAMIYQHIIGQFKLPHIQIQLYKFKSKMSIICENSLYILVYQLTKRAMLVYTI